MTARTSIQKETIVEAALDLVRNGGWESVSARSIAARLGASTMPIYSAIGSMDDLKTQALLTASRLLDAAQRKPRTGNEALDQAVGYVVFAREEPRLFRFLVQAQSHLEKAIPELTASREYRESFGASSQMHEVFRQLGSTGQRNDFVLRSMIFAFGLAELVSGGQLEMDEVEIIRHLQAAGAAFYLYEKSQKEGR